MTKRIDSAKRRNTPRFLGNPASGVKPMYGVTEGGKSCGDTREQSSTSNKNSNTKSEQQKTLLPSVSSQNSPIVSPPPYSPSARGTCYPFNRDLCARGDNTGGPISPRNSPINMLSTSPYIQSPTPNTHPRMYFSSPYTPPFPDTSRFPNPLIRSPIGIPAPPSAFHSNLPPPINKLLPRTSYMQSTGVYSQQQTISQPPAVQRIPASSTHPAISAPKSPKKSNSPGASFAIAKSDGPGGSEKILGHSGSKIGDVNAFNLSKTAGASQQQDFKNISSLVCTTASTNTAGTTTNTVSQGKKEVLGKVPQSNDREGEKKETSQEVTDLKTGDGERVGEKCEEKSTVEKKDSGTKLNGDLPGEGAMKSQQGLEVRIESDCREVAKTKEEGKDCQKLGAGATPICGDKNLVPGKEGSEGKGDEQIGKSGEIQGKNSKTTSVESERNKAES